MSHNTNIVVMKFGGTSVRDESARFAAMKHIHRNVDNGKKVVVVVSAMGRKGEPYATDTLIHLLKTVKGSVSICPKELDLVMSCGEILSAAYFSHLINQHQLPGITFTGFQAGILTDNNAGEAEILDINPKRILQALDDGKIPVVAGFQGANADGDVRTLGRGGSDTSAVALGAALKAEKVEIYSDVDGIACADPRQAPNAKFLENVSAQHILTMADEGSKVIHPRAVKASLQTETPIVARNTFNQSDGTTIYHGTSKIDKTVTIAHRDNLVLIEHEKPRDISDKLDMIKVSETKYLLHDNVYLEEKMTMLKRMNTKFKIRRNYATVSVVFGESISKIIEIPEASIIGSDNCIIRYLTKSENLTKSISRLFNHYL